MPPPVITPPPPLTAAPETKAKPSKIVKASYQGTAAAGRPTASGEPYNPKALTAASPNLPMGSTIKVTNTDTGRSVKVRINDRGPVVPGRSLDLSKHAAEKIGIVDKGVSRVKITPVASHPASGEARAPSPIATPASESIPAGTLPNAPVSGK